MAGRIRVYIAASLDGFIAGPGDDLSWLGSGDTAESTTGVGFDAFLGEIGALLVGRRTYEVVAGFDSPWPFGDRPVLVATHRALASPHPTVRAVSGTIPEIIGAARLAAGGLDVYVDGGDLIRQVLDAGLLDEAIVTVVPVVLGAGIPLFAGSRGPHRFEFVSTTPYGDGMVQILARALRAS